MASRRRARGILALADRVTVLRDCESVGTHRVAGIDEAGLIRLMVGREVSQIYPPAEGPAGEEVLALKNLGCREGGVHGVSLAIRAGVILGLAGLVGAGRTELARVLFGVTPADSGGDLPAWLALVLLHVFRHNGYLLNKEALHGCRNSRSTRC